MPPMTMNRITVFRAPDGEGGGSPAPASAPGAEAAAPPADIPQRPDYLPEKFWDAKKGEANYKGLAQSYVEIESRHRAGRDALRSEIEQAIRDEVLEEVNKPKEGVPEKPDGYTFEIPDVEGLPKGMAIGIDEDDPMLKTWREIAFEHKLPQEIFQKGIDAYVHNTFAQLPQKAEEMRKLGDKAEARINAVDTWLSKNLDERSYSSIVAYSTTASFVEAMEKLMLASGGPQLGNDTGTRAPEPPPTKEALREAMRDPRYHDPRVRDEGYVAQVTEMARKVAAARRRA